MKVKSLRVSLGDARKHLDALWEGNSISKVCNGNFVVFTEDGWVSKPPLETAIDLSSNLEGFDVVREKLASLGTLPPVTTLVLETEEDEAIDIPFDDETHFAEPQAWIYLKTGASIEVTHEENGLNLPEQYFSMRVHCSDEDFENDKYHATCGIVAAYAGGLSAIAKPLIRYIETYGLENN